MKKNKLRLLEDFAMIGVGIVLAIFLVKSGAIEYFVSATHGYVLASFIAGIFFTSFFTVAPASIALVEIAEKAPFGYVMFFGACGALMGDLILFYFIRDRFADDVKKILKKSTLHFIVKSFHFGFLKWLSPLIGAFIIASPLPDEFGISLLGISRIRVIFLIPISFTMNAFGIYLLIKFSEIIS